MAVGLLCLLLTTVLSVASPWVLRYAVDDLVHEVTRNKLYRYAGFLVALTCLEGFFRYHMRMILIGISREVEFALRNSVFAHLSRLPASYYESHRIGEVMSRATNDMTAVRMVLGPGIMYTANTIATFVGTVTLMLTLSPRLLGLALLPLVFVSFLVRHFGRKIHDRFEAVQAQLAEISALVQESLAGARVVRAYVQEAHEAQRFEIANQEFLQRNRRLIRMFGGLYPGIQLLMGIGALTVLWQGGQSVVLGQLSLGQFVAFSSYLAMLQWPMIAVGWVVNIFERGEASMGRIQAVLDVTPAIRDEDPLPVTAVGGDVDFRGLSFAYDAATVLHDIDLHVAAGTTVAIVGPTGSGKTTLVSLIPRLLEAPAGSLYVDGHEARRLPLAVLRGAVGFVPQETFLFSATLRENVALGLPDADEARWRWAADLAQLSKDVQDFPAGFDTLVGERGVTLSGGQRQRTALARALALDPRVLVLDDALSAVDTETEEAILRGLRGVLASRTTFLVSHRVSTAKEADLIVVLREGRIAEQGSHEHLLAQGGFYADLYRRQVLQAELETEA